jgi:hypothetical protein
MLRGQVLFDALIFEVFSRPLHPKGRNLCIVFGCFPQQLCRGAAQHGRTRATSSHHSLSLPTSYFLSQSSLQDTLTLKWSSQAPPLTRYGWPLGALLHISSVSQFTGCISAHSLYFPALNWQVFSHFCWYQSKFDFPHAFIAITSLYSFYFDVIRGGQYVWEVEEMHNKYGMLIGPYLTGETKQFRSNRENPT